MNIRLKLYANLSDYLPSDATQNIASVEVPDGACLNWVIDNYKIPREQAHLVLLNGLFQGQAERESVSLKEGDTLAIWPPVAGG